MAGYRGVKWRYSSLAAVLLTVLLSSCTGNHAENLSVDLDLEENAVQEVPTDLETSAAFQSFHGTISNLSASLEKGQADVIFSYMEQYYRSLAQLETDITGVPFAKDTEVQQVLCQTALEYAVGLRTQTGNALTLADYQYELTIESVKVQSEQTVIQLLEHSIQYFNRSPEIRTETYGTHHTFILVLEDSNWKILSHIQSDGIYYNLMGEFWGQETEQIPNVTSYLIARRDYLLAEAEEQTRIRLEQMENKRDAQEKTKVHHPYDRKAAVAYADTWVGQRNQEWDDFSGQGGNCQNFVSQCLFAAGIPRDISGDAIWSWGREAGTFSENQMDTISWINVKTFLDYASENMGYGLSADTEVDYWSGETGDVLQMGFPDIWNHAVLISSIVTDEDGVVIDYLIDSNTSDMKNYPASAYPLPCQSLTKIYGWNEF